MGDRDQASEVPEGQKSREVPEGFRKNRNELLRKIPKIDRLMEMESVKAQCELYGYQIVLEAARKAQEQLREVLRTGSCIGSEESCLETGRQESPADVPKRNADESECLYDEKNKEQNIQSSSTFEQYLLVKMQEILSRQDQRRMQRVINATGVILHTNLGRAPLGEKLVFELVPLMTGYTNLEMNLEDGKRGSRYDHFSENLCRLTGAEACLAVNNNAAAVLVMLTVLASGGETVVSRGELVEIGGKFRIPDVCSQSGTTLVEVGTTNRTYLEDYQNAVTENTAAFLKVHTSNYQITGFTHEPTVEELAKAAHSHEIPLLVDLGSGCLVDLASYGLGTEKQVQELLAKGADLVSFSGDKLLGGPQAGILAGRRDLIEKIAKHPLMRALRIDKFTAASLDRTISLYLKEDIRQEIPVYEMMSRSAAQLETMARELATEVVRFSGEHISERNSRLNSWEKPLPGQPQKRGFNQDANSRFLFEIVPTTNVTGGGTTPGKTLPGFALGIKPRDSSICAEEISHRLRTLSTPVIGHIQDDCVYLEMRTLLPGDLEILKKELKDL